MQAPLQFLSLPNADIETADVLILPVPYERTVTYRKGTAQGPEAILAASDQLEFYEEDRGWCPTLFMKLSVLPPFYSDSDTEAQADFHHRLSHWVGGLPGNNLFIALGGEHSITPPMVFARMPEGGTLVQIDAHADLRPSYKGSPYNHACPMFRVRERGYTLIQIGIRSLHADEAKLAKDDQGITLFLDRELQRPHCWRALLSRLGKLSGPVWLTIDMDGLDPALVSSVGTPQPGGLSWYQVLDIIDCLTSNAEVDLRGIDMVELIPEPSAVSQLVTAKLIQKSISYWGLARGFHRRRPSGSQVGVADE